MNGKILTLVRGLPGSGKSTFARFIWSEYVVCEADQFFVGEDGVYRFDGSKIKDAHKWCRDKVETFMSDNQLNGQFYPEIVVSNTFTQEWEMDEYYKLAEKYGYTVFSIIVENRHGGVNEHGVPADKLEQMKNRFEISL
jgi:predicted kinase